MRYLYAHDVAVLRGVSTSTARAWLALLERRYGPRVVGRVGKRLFTTESSLARIGPDFANGRLRDAALEQRIRRIEKAVRILRDAIAELSRDIRSDDPRACVEIVT